MLKYDNIKEIELIIRLREIKHRITFKKRYLPMQQAMERYKACDNERPRSKMKKEMVVYI